MKLIYIANARIPTEKAHGIQIMQMCEAFSNSGIKVLLITPWRFNWIKRDPFNYYGIKKNFRIKKLPCIDLIPLDFILKNLALWVQTISFLIFVKVYLMFKKYDILYTREQFTGLFFKDFILEIHSLSKKIKPFHKKIWKKSKKLIVLTTFLKKRLIETDVSGNKILVVPDGVDLEKFDIGISKKEARKKLRLLQNKNLIVYTGHLYDWKGVKTPIEASKLLNKNNLVIFVGGTKKDIKNLKSQVSNSKLENVLVVGHRPHSEIPYWLKAADVLVLTGTKTSNISEKYTSPMKMFEYMASKRPIIASDLPSFREVLNDRNAVLVKPDNAQVFLDGIKQTLENLHLSDRISEQAYKDVQKYTWNKRVEKILRFLIKI